MLDVLIKYAPTVQAIASLLAVIIGLISVVISLRAIKFQERNSRLALKPILELDFDEDAAFTKVSIKNRGRGLARIDEICIFVDGKKYDSLDEFYSHFDTDISKDRVSINNGDIVNHDEPPINVFEVKNVLAKRACISAAYHDLYDFRHETKRNRIK